MMFLGLILIGVVVYLLARPDRETRSTGDDPMDILKRRYAEGSITQEEFLRMKEVMQQNR